MLDMIKKILLIFILTFSINAIAENTEMTSDGYYKVYEECLEKAAGGTSVTLECTSAEIRRQDKLLNLYYQKLMKNLDDSGRKELKKAQIAWIKWRDADSSFLYNNIEGTLVLIIGNSDYLVKTKERVDFFRTILGVFFFEK